MKSILLALYVLVSAGKDSYGPVKNAFLACQEIPVQDEEGEVESGGFMVPTDSRGRIVFSGVYQTYHCMVMAEGYYAWTGTLVYDGEHRERSVVLTRVR